LRFVTLYRERGDHGALRGLLRTSATAIAAASAVAGAFAMAAGLLSDRSDVDPWLAAGVALLVFPLAAMGWLSAVIRSFNRIFASQAYDQLFRPALLILLLGLAWAAGLSLGAPLALWLTLAAVALPLAILAMQVRREVARLGPGQADHSDRRLWLAVGWPLFLLSLFQEASNQVDLILLGILKDAASAADFAAAMRLSSLASFGLVAVVSVSAPAIASAFHRGDRAAMARLATMTARMSLLFAILVVTALLIFGRVALAAFGPSFPDAFPVLAILCLGALVSAFTGSVGYFLLMTGHERTAATIMAGALLVAVTLDVLLIPTFGAVGAAIASAGGLATWNLAMLVAVRRRLGIDCSPIGAHVRA
jgi:O-antigen/teichoic acid export membrane protein